MDVGSVGWVGRRCWQAGSQAVRQDERASERISINFHCRRRRIYCVKWYLLSERQSGRAILVCFLFCFVFLAKSETKKERNKRNKIY